MSLICLPEYVFIHNPKTGGTSIRGMLGDRATWRDPKAHLSAEEMRGKICVDEQNTAAWNKAFKFAFVRNPYDWVEIYRVEVMQYATHPMHSTSLNPVKWAEAFSMACAEEREVSVGKMLFQSEIVGRDILDEIFRFEQFNWSCMRIQNILGIDVPIPHSNAKEYEPVRDPEYRSVIRELFAVDFERFGYA